MKQADIKIPAFSIKYRYSNVPIERYGEFELLPPGKSFYSVELQCAGDVADPQQTVSILFDGQKIGELPQNRLKDMWHDFTLRGDVVSASVDFANGEYTLSLSYRIPSSKVYQDLDYRGFVKVEHTLYNVEMEKVCHLENYAELSIDEDEDDFELCNISSAADMLGRFPENVAKLVDDVTNCRVFLKEVLPCGESSATVIVHIFLDTPFETQIFRQQRSAPPSAPIPAAPQVLHRVSITFDKSSGARKAALTVQIDDGELRVIKGGETDSFSLPEGSHFFRFSHDEYQSIGLNIDLKNDVDMSASLKFWSNSIDVRLIKRGF